MIHVAIWYLVVMALGFLAWPLAFRLLPGLADRGYAMSRALGLLLVGYLFWTLGSLGFLQNSVGGIILVALLVAGLSIWAYRTRSDKAESLLSWAKSHASYVVTAEIIFAVAFACWAVVRAYNPELNSTERPMELAFLNSAVHSPNLPPLDPWLSGYAISYYYFGYILMGMIAKFADTPVSVAFNIGIALLFAFTLLNSYGLVYNLNMSIEHDRKPSVSARLFALLGPLFVGVMGNLEGLLELIRAFNLPFISQQFWAWLDLEDLTEPVTRVLWPPDTWRFWWWWRASRVIRDRDIAGVAIGLQPIDEFPMFSFLLGDMHPHVLALPFVILALALAFNVLSQKDSLSRPQIALYVVAFGGLAFLNTWDLPIYLFILVAALVLKQFRADGQKFVLANMWKPAATGVGILALGIVAYVTWYIGFTSQAGGILPNAIFPTRLHQFFIMFGPFLILILIFLLDRLLRLRGAPQFGKAALAGFCLLIALILVMTALGYAAIRAEAGARAFVLQSAGYNKEGLTDEQINAVLPDAISAVVENRLLHPLTPLFLTIIIIGALAVLVARPISGSDESPPTAPFDLPTGFVLILIVAGAMLTLGPEFVYLRDHFQQRLNTVFKFYYAAWLLFAVATAFGVYAIVRQSSEVGKIAIAVIAAPLVVAGLIYPVFAIPAKMGSLIRADNAPPPTLDGIDYIRQNAPSDYKAIIWLQTNAEPGSMVLEAVGGSYNASFGRVSSATGLPTLIGWPQHESQWRGALFDELAGGREGIVREIYNTTSVARATQLLAENSVIYVFVGTTERSAAYASPIGLQKFDRFLTAVFRDGDTVIYRADQPLAEETP